MNNDLVDLLECSWCHQGGFTLEALAAGPTGVETGRLVCTSCKTWFKIDQGIVDLLPRPLRRDDLYREFAARHGYDYAPAPDAAASGSQKHGQIEFFGTTVEDYEQNVVRTPLYHAINEAFYDLWLVPNIRPGQRVLDIGCGVGEQAVAVAGRGIRYVGIDISEEMLRLAQDKVRRAGLTGSVDLVVGDGELQPVRPESFDGFYMLGCLHHMPDPARALRNAAARIKPGAHFFTQDPHASPLRPVFDWLMRVWHLYDEKASDDPLVTAPKLRAWARGAGLTSRVRWSVFLPPHAFYPFTNRGAYRFLRGTDLAFGSIPGLRSLSGFMMCSGVRLPPSTGAKA